MNNKGQVGMGIIGAIFIFIIGIASVNFVMDDVVTARADLQCASAETISDATKMLCLVVDTTVIYWIILIVSIAGGLVLSKFNI